MTETHAAFIELADLFKELPETFTDEFKEVTPQAQLQGYRHLAHLLAYGFELYMERGQERCCRGLRGGHRETGLTALLAG